MILSLDSYPQEAASRFWLFNQQPSAPSHRNVMHKLAVVCQGLGCVFLEHWFYSELKKITLLYLNKYMVIECKIPLKWVEGHWRVWKNFWRVLLSYRHFSGIPFILTSAKKSAAYFSKVVLPNFLTPSRITPSSVISLTFLHELTAAFIPLMWIALLTR